MKTEVEFWSTLMTAGAAFIATVIKFLSPSAKHNARIICYEVAMGLTYCLYIGPWAKEFFELSDRGMNLTVFIGTLFSAKILQHIDELIALYAGKLKGGKDDT